MLIDTHCHIHDPEFFTPAEAEAALERALQAGTGKIICVATSLEDSKRAIAFAKAHPEHCWATIGIHPHEVIKFSLAEIQDQLAALEKLANDTKVVAVGECGFDFYYNKKETSLKLQTALLRGQIEIALRQKLPLSFHVRAAFEEFWPIFESYQQIKGVLHSFTDSPLNLECAIKHKLLIGINGIATFTTKKWQSDLFQSIKDTNFILETDSPFLTPKPIRGNINSPENVIYITKYLAELRGESEEMIAKATTANAESLFNL